MSRSALFSVALLCAIALYTGNARATTSLLQAIKTKQVSMNAVKNIESYHGKGLDLHLKNNTSKTISISIDPAMIFKPADSGYQDLVIINDEVVVLKAGEEQTIAAQSFCAKSYARAPAYHLQYNFWKQGDTLMVKLLRYIVANKVNTSLAQDAVWVLTNGHALENIYLPGNDTESFKLAAFMTVLLHKPKPVFFTYHELIETPEAIPYNPRPLKMLANFEYISTSDQVLTLGVYNEDGSTAELVFEDKRFERGGHRFRVEFEAADVPAGNYYIRLTSYGKVLKEQKVKID